MINPLIFLRSPFLQYFLLFTILNVAFNASGQVHVPKPLSGDKTPVGEKVASIGIFGDVPVGNFTGVPQINVPLHSVSYRDLNLNISIGYHNAIGNKPDIMPGNLGMGWVLFAGGSISRTFRELTGDDLTGNPQTQPSNLNPTYRSDWASDSLINEYLENNFSIANDSGKYDAFSYNFNGNSGKIFFDHFYKPHIRSSQGESFKMEWTLLNQHKFKVATEAQGPTILGYPPITYKDSINQLNIIYKFILTDANGIKYTFGGTDESLEFSRPGVEEGGLADIHKKIIAVNWQLTSIEAPDGSKIILKYKRGNIVVTRQGLTLYSTITRSNPNNALSETPIYRGEKHTLINPSYLEKIITPKEVITFTGSSATDQLQYPNSSPGRTDYENVFIYYQDVKFAPTENRFYEKIDRFVVSDSLGTQFKRVNFNYTTSTSTRLKLTGISISGSTDSNNNPYHYNFEYNSTPLPAYLSFKVDAYGFYNNKVDTDSTLMYNRNRNLYNSSRSPDSAYAKAEILTKIIYPTRGFTTFEYELHQYGKKATTWPFITTANPLDSIFYTGGLRIQKITDYEAAGVISSKRNYLYVRDYAAGGVKSSGVLSYVPVFDQDIMGTLTAPAFFADSPSDFTGTIRSQKFSTNPLNVIKSEQGSHITYSEVVEKNSDGSFRIFKYKNYDNGYHDHPAVNYVSDHTTIQEFWKLDGGNSMDLERGQVLSEEDYDINSNLKRRTSYGYNNDTSRFNEHVRVFRKGINPIYSIMSGMLSIRYTASLMYTYFPYLKTRTVETFLGMDSLVQTVSYKYDHASRLVTEQGTIASNGQVNTTKYKYPKDMLSNGQTVPYQEMVNRNLLGYLVEKEQLVDNILKIKEFTHYKNTWNSYTSSFLPSLQSRQLANSPIDTLLQIDSYDKRDNLTSTSVNGGKKVTYIWSYHYQYPIAKVENADYTTLETVLGGKSAVEQIAAKNPSDAEVITFLAPLRSSTSLKGAFVTTYTYSPMHGMTSEISHMGKATYYEYDAFSRLKYIKDQNQNIVESFCYNNAGQQTDCSLNPPPNLYMLSTSIDKYNTAFIPSYMLASVPVYSHGHNPQWTVLDLPGSPIRLYYADEALTELLPTGYYTADEMESGHWGRKLYYFENGRLMFSTFYDMIEPEIIPDDPVRPIFQPIKREPSNIKNYIVRNKVLVQDVFDANDLKSLQQDEVRQNVTYHDGLGRVAQHVTTNGSPTYRDIVTPVVYDDLGREPKKFLAYVDTVSIGGSYKTQALYHQNNYYNFGSWDSSIVKTNFPFSETIFEPSLLARVLEQGSPGTSWQLSEGHTQKINYGFNNSSSYYITYGFAVRLHTAGLVLTSGKEHERSLSGSGYYDSNQLHLTIYKDENWIVTDGKAGTTEEYKDKEGKVILKRIFNRKPDNNIETLSTYYVYDELKNLSFVLPPGADPDATLVPNQTTLDNFCYQYRYDRKGRLIEKKIPGKGWEYFVYNKLDQVVLTQDSVQRLNAKWIFSKYDALGRTILNGIINSGTERAAWQTIINGHLTLWEERDNTDGSVTGTGYTNSTLPAHSLVQSYYVVTYYDDYSFLGNSFSGPVSGQRSEVKGLATGSKVNILGGNTMLLSVSYYDEEGRVTQSKSQNHLGGTDVLTNTYSFAGELLTSIRTHVVGGNTTTVANRYEYDHMGRKKISAMQINSSPEIILHKSTYNEIGQLLKKAMHSEERALKKSPFCRLT